MFHKTQTKMKRLYKISLYRTTEQFIVNKQFIRALATFCLRYDAFFFLNDECLRHVYFSAVKNGSQHAGVLQAIFPQDFIFVSFSHMLDGHHISCIQIEQVVKNWWNYILTLTIFTGTLLDGFCQTRYLCACCFL